MTGFTKRRMLGALVIVTCTGAALATAEILTRMIDGYRLTSIRLEIPHDRLSPADPGHGSGSQKLRGDADALPFVRQLPVAAGVDQEWFAIRFPERPQQPDKELAARAKRYKDIPDSRPNYEWNARYVGGVVCRDNPVEGAETFKQFDDIYVFDPIDGSESPPFRFLRQATYPSGLRTNVFGWRGPDIPLHKPPRTVRIAFVGASTTVGHHTYPYSYPELVGLWLKRWTASHHPGVSFEVINAGREGLNSGGVQAVVRQELVPVEPDLVVYYEGSNQFWPADFINVTLPPRSRVAGPRPGVLASYLAIVRRVESVVRDAVVPGYEPPKPRILVNWPPNLDENDPDLANPNLPIKLPRILADVETIRQVLDAEGSRFVMTSFYWLVYPGMILDPERDAFLFEYLNTTYWPFSYAHMRRFLDFQNRVFRKYAATHGVDFLDVAAAIPRDPRLFDDAIHMTPAGIRLHAWIVFNGLVPIIERRLASHEWPRPARHSLSSHPAFGERRLMPMAAIRAACGTAAH